ncbi:transglutaminase domain-containing protein [Kallipyga massiliensis]|uniref:transglutaminase family protein n=1 Tax=Kallipyga massiliensis TaxID=1472764 RepID=UPI001C54F4C4|nr:transglutaminase domain-containing protein [Kallipyga massiliensis]
MKTKKEWAQTLQSWLTSSVFALCLSYFGLRLVGQYAPSVGVNFLFSLAIVLSVCLLSGLVFKYWKISLPIVALSLLLLIVQWVSGSDFGLSFLSPSFWLSKEGAFQRILGWIQATSIEDPLLMPQSIPNLILFGSSLLSVLTIWALPIPLLNLLFLIGPLFFIEDLTVDLRWMPALLAGLFCVYASYAFRQDPAGRDQRPPISFGLTLVGLTFLLSLVIPSDTFFNPDFHRFLNDKRPMEGGEVTAFSLKELGFYPQGNLHVGGPVKPSEDPYIDVTAGPDALYLRGSTYDAFDGHSWSYKNEQILKVFPWDLNFFDDVTSDKAKSFWFTDKAVRDRALQDGLIKPTILIQRPHRDTKVVFTPGKPGLLGRLLQAPDGPINPMDPFTGLQINNSFLYSENGMVVSESPYHEFGMVSIDHYIPLRKVVDPQSLASYTPTRVKGERALENNVAVLDSSLHEIVYGEEKDFASLVSQIQDHFSRNYSYNLNASTISDDELFIDNFLTNKEGYCVYFASAMTILLRDLGYETRYAEGFVLPFMDIAPDDVANRTLTANQAHAWCEVHMEGLGWIPVEATPSSHMETLSGLSLNHPDDQPTPEEPEDSQESSEDLSEESGPEASIDEESSTPIDNDTSEDEKSPKSPLEASGAKWMVFGLIILVFALGLAFYVIGKDRRWKERQLPASLDRAKTGPRETMDRIWTEIKRMGQEEGLSIQRKDTVKDLLDKLYVKYDWKEINEVQASLEAFRYGEEEPTREDLQAIHRLYIKLSAERKRKLSKTGWLFGEVFKVPRKPW